MNYYHHKDIDHSRWDSLVKNSTNPRIYMLSWYLDITSPGWKAIIWLDYKAVLPLYVKRLFVIKYVAGPWLSQQTGIIHGLDFNYKPALKDFFRSRIFKSFLRFTINFHSGIDINSLDLPRSSRFKRRKNFVLNLNLPKDELQRNFNENRKRNLKKAHSIGWTCVPSDNINPAIEMYKSNQGLKQKDINNIFQVIENIYRECSKRNLAELYCCTNERGEALAWCFFARFEKRVYYLFGAMNEKGKKHSAMSLIFQFVISKYSNQDLILDFEGGNIEGIGSYFESFGATAETYYSFTRNRI